MKRNKEQELNSLTSTQKREYQTGWIYCLWFNIDL